MNVYQDIDITGDVSVSGQADVKSLGTNAQAAVNSLISAALLAAFPVGTTVMSPTNPASVVGGSWQQESAGKFFRTAASQTSSTTDGGSDDAIVVSHTHSDSGVVWAKGNSSNTGNYQVHVLNQFPGDFSNITTNTIESTGQSGMGANLPTYKGRVFWTRIS